MSIAEYKRLGDYIREVNVRIGSIGRCKLIPSEMVRSRFVDGRSKNAKRAQ